MTKAKEAIGYAERVSERIVVCGTKEKGRKQERLENLEAKNLPHGRTLTTNQELHDHRRHNYQPLLAYPSQMAVRASHQ